MMMVVVVTVVNLSLGGQSDTRHDGEGDEG
jgi:hypothetical protein